MAKKKERTVQEIKDDKSGNRTKEEIKKLDNHNTRSGKLYKSIVNPKKKK